jgi:hypothetical protein
MEEKSWDEIAKEMDALAAKLKSLKAGTRYTYPNTPKIHPRLSEAERNLIVDALNFYAEQLRNG